jgi:hypothetical protein
MGRVIISENKIAKLRILSKECNHVSMWWMNLGFQLVFSGKFILI